MSKRLQVLLDDTEYRTLQRLAQKQGMTVSEWVRQAIRAMRRQEPVYDTARKLSAIREGTRHAYPAPDISEMLAEIERGYASGAP
jgi:predicted transcriptional regulator